MTGSPPTSSAPINGCGLKHPIVGTPPRLLRLAGPCTHTYRNPATLQSSQSSGRRPARCCRSDPTTSSGSSLLRPLPHHRTCDRPGQPGRSRSSRRWPTAAFGQRANRAHRGERRTRPSAGAVEGARRRKGRQAAERAIPRRTLVAVDVYLGSVLSSTARLTTGHGCSSATMEPRSPNSSWIGRFDASPPPPQ